MLTIMFMHHSLVGSERFYGDTPWNEDWETSSFHNMTTVVANLIPQEDTANDILGTEDDSDLESLDPMTPSPGTKNFLLEQDDDVIEASVNLLRERDDDDDVIEGTRSLLLEREDDDVIEDTIDLLLEREDDDVIEDGSEGKRDSFFSQWDHDSESASYHDARSSVCQEADLILSQDEEEENNNDDEEEEEEFDGEEKQRIEKIENGLGTDDVVLIDEGCRKEVSHLDPPKNICCDNIKAYDCARLQTLPSGKDGSDVTLGCDNNQSPSVIRNIGVCEKENERISGCKELCDNQTIADDGSALEQKVNDNYGTPQGERLASLGVFSPGHYLSKTLGRPARKSRNVPGPVSPHKPARESRSKTEPPPELAPPDILQVSWVWETRSPTRNVSIRRRPSRRVSCRRRSRPRLALGKSSGSRGSASPRRKFSNTSSQAPGDSRPCSPWNERLDEAHSYVNYPPVAPDVLSYRYQRNPPSNTRFLPCCDTETVISSNTTLPREAEGEVKMRKKRSPNYFQSASKALKQKWRNSEIMLPKFFSESTEDIEAPKAGKSRRKEFLEKAKALPLQMRRLSYLLFKNSKHMEHEDPNFLLETSRDGGGLASRLGRRRKSMRRSNGTGIKRQGSFSPRNSFKINTINWNQKYQNVMNTRRNQQREDSFEGDDFGIYSPVIQVTEADNDEAFVSEDDTVSTSHLHPHQKLKGGGGRSVLGKLFNRIRTPSISTTRSFASSRSSMSGGSEDGHSPSHSSDYEDQEDNERSGSASLVGRMRGLRRDMQKKISRLKSPRGSTSSSPIPVNHGDKAGAGLQTPSNQQQNASSYESLPSSAPVASTTTVGSNRSSLSGEEAEPYTGPFIGRAKALANYQPSPYDRDALKFKKGDIIDIVAKNPSGLWKGCVDGRVGHFKFILVEEEVERPTRRSRPSRGTTPRRGRACTLEELLSRLHLGHLIQVFVLNGYEDLEQFRDVEKGDLDCLGITDPETRAKLLTAVALLHDADSEPEQDLPETLETTEAVLRRGDHGRDSGCYTDHRSTTMTALDENNLDTRQSTPSTDTSSGYHSRGASYNIPLGEATLTSRDDHSSALDSPSSESTTTCFTAPSTTHTEPHSYRAHLATVLPASPRAKLRHGQHGDGKGKPDSDVDYEAKYNSARSVFEKEVPKREVPFTVRSPKRSIDSQSPTEELEDEEKNDTSVAMKDEVSP